MKELKFKLMLYKLKRKIQVNHTLKSDLRNQFASQKEAESRLKRFVALATAVCLLIAGTVAFNLAAPSPVSASSLKIENYVSFANIGGGRSLSVSESQGIVYVNLFGAGIFTYNDGGFKELHAGNVNSVDVSENGKTLVFSEDGSIKTLDLKSGKVTVVLQGNEKTNYFDVSWLPDNHSILYTCEAEKTIIESTVNILDFNSMKTQEVAKGAHASYIKGQDAIVYENRIEGKVIYKSLKNHSEKVIDYGTEPNASPDGKYIVFTKSEVSTEEIKKNVKVETGLQNIYIVDTDDFTAMKKVTQNIPLITIDREEWVKNLLPSNEEQILSYSGRYCYLHPTWSSDSRSIFAMKRITGENPGKDEVRLIKISFDKKDLSSKELVQRYLQAEASGEGDYSNSLTGFSEQKTSQDNAVLAGYDLLSEGSDGNQKYVDALCYFTVNGKLEYRLESIRYYLGKKDMQTVITGKKILNTVTVQSGGNQIEVRNADRADGHVITLGDLPNVYTGSKEKFGAVAFSPESKVLYFTLRSDERKDTIRLLSFSLEDKAVKLLDTISKKGAELGAAKLIADPADKFVAFEYGAKEDASIRYDSIVYTIGKNLTGTSLSSISGQEKASGINIAFGDNGNVIFKNLTKGQFLWFEFLPDKNEVQAIK